MRRPKQRTSGQQGGASPWRELEVKFDKMFWRDYDAWCSNADSLRPYEYKGAGSKTQGRDRLLALMFLRSTLDRRAKLALDAILEALRDEEKIKRYLVDKFGVAKAGCGKEKKDKASGADAEGVQGGDRQGTGMQGSRRRQAQQGVAVKEEPGSKGGGAGPVGEEGDAEPGDSDDDDDDEEEEAGDGALEDEEGVEEAEAQHKKQGGYAASYISTTGSVLAKFVVYAHTLLPSSATQQQRDQKMSEARAMKERLLTVTKRLGDDVRMARKAQPVKGALPLASLYHMQDRVEAAAYQGLLQALEQLSPAERCTLRLPSSLSVETEEARATLIGLCCRHAKALLQLTDSAGAPAISKDLAWLIQSAALLGLQLYIPPLRSQVLVDLQVPRSMAVEEAAVYNAERARGGKVAYVPSEEEYNARNRLVVVAAQARAGRTARSAPQQVQQLRLEVPNHKAYRGNPGSLNCPISFEFREPATMWLWLHLKLARPVLVQRPEGHRKPPNTRVFQAKEADSLNPTRLCRWYKKLFEKYADGSLEYQPLRKIRHAFTTALNMAHVPTLVGIKQEGGGIQNSRLSGAEPANIPNQLSVSFIMGNAGSKKDMPGFGTASQRARYTGLPQAQMMQEAVDMTPAFRKHMMAEEARRRAQASAPQPPPPLTPFVAGFLGRPARGNQQGRASATVRRRQQQPGLAAGAPQSQQVAQGHLVQRQTRSRSQAAQVRQAQQGQQGQRAQQPQLQRQEQEQRQPRKRQQAEQPLQAPPKPPPSQEQQPAAKRRRMAQVSQAATPSPAPGCVTIKEEVEEQEARGPRRLLRSNSRGTLFVALA